MLAQVGIIEESVYATPVTSGMVFNGLVSDSVKQDVERMESAGIISGRRVETSDQWSQGRVTVAGDLGLELTNKSLRKWFKQMFGGESGTGPYTYTPGDLTGMSSTIQIGTPGVGGATHPRTLAGTKFSSWEIAVKEGEIATLGVTVVAQKEIGYRVTSADGNTTNTQPTITSATAAFGPDDVGKPISGTNIPAGTTILSVQSATAATMSANATGTASTTVFTIGLALAAASYASSYKPLHYDGATITIGGTAYKVKEATVAGDNKLDDGRRFLGQRWIDEPLEADLREYTGTLNGEFIDRTMYNRFLNGAEAALVVTISDGTDSVAITQNVRFDGVSPNIGDRGIVQQSIPYKAVASGADSTAISAVISQA
jgi:hypothetical protein